MKYSWQSIKKIILKKDFLNNYFNTNYKNNVLIIYITEPLMFGPHKFHSNQQEAIEIAKIFSRLKYNVDVLDYMANFEKINFNKSRYDVIFGLEPNFLKAIAKFKLKKSVYYATGAYCEFQNKAEKRRLDDLSKRKNIQLSPKRFVPPHRSSELADAVIGIGNEWTKSTYEGKCKKYYPIPISAYKFFNIKEINKNKNWNQAKKNFLWFGSVGLVHKGLDLLIEIFEQNSDLHLYVCGNVGVEKDFYGCYKYQLENLKNIHNVGWVEPGSNDFKKLMKKCGYTVLLSCSEGMSGSIATTMFSGLVPIISKETGIDVDHGNGFIVEDLSIKNLVREFSIFGNVNNGVMKKMSVCSYEYARQTYSIRNFSKNFNSSLIKILK